MRILRDVVTLLLASALAFVPIAAVHSCAEAHPLADTGDSSGSTQAETSARDSANAQASASSSAQSNSNAQANLNAQTLNSYYLTNGNFVTSVKLQNPWGACWAFAIASAVESSILKAQAKLDGDYDQREAECADAASPKLSGLGGAVDVSERAIAWLSHQLQTEDSAGDQAGEGLYRVNANDYTTQLAGGNFSIVEAALAARQGLLSENTAPYQYNGYRAGSIPWYSSANEGVDARQFDWSVSDGLRNVNDIGWYISGVVELPSPAITQYDFASGTVNYTGYDADATLDVKQALIDLGAVAISLEAETSLPGDVRSTSHFDYSTWSQYNSANAVYTNHAVSIVGWDDSYSAANFSGTESGQPPADGAWLCKNNWGSDDLYDALGGSASATHWGISDAGRASGFFWLSYYDHTITSPTAFEVSPLDESHDSLYQYDYLGMSEYSEPSSYMDVLRVGNVFTAESTELLKSVTAQTFREDETVTCWIYTLPMEDDEKSDQDDGADSNDGGSNSDDNNGGNGNNDSSNNSGNSSDEPNAIELTESDSAARTVIYSEQVDINAADGGPTGDGTLVSTTERTFDHAGFHELELDSPVLVAAGQRFAVVERVQANVPLEDENAEASYLNLELAFRDPPSEGAPIETMAQVVANPGETYVSIQPDLWMSLEEFNGWYEAAQEGGAEMTFGNALVKALTNKTSMGSGEQVYELVAL